MATAVENGGEAAAREREREVTGGIKRKQEIADRLSQFGTSVFAEITALAIKHGAVNLGQGFPNFDGPEFVKAAAMQAIADGKGQYAPMGGIPDLTKAIAAQFEKDSGLKVDPASEITVTCGCTEAAAATMLGLVNPGEEVILFQPFYDSYLATLSMAGAKVKVVTLRPPEYALPEKELRAAFSPKTRAILINTPHNPTGKVFSRSELEFIAALCKEFDAIAVSDEVYHKLVYEGEHISIASLPGMYERTVTLNSLGKTFSLTGWKIGWAIANPNLTWGIRQAHSYVTFAVSTPLQWGAVAALSAPDSYYEELSASYSAKRDKLVQGLKEAGFEVYEPKGTFFVMANHTMFGYGSDVDFCKHLIEEVGVAAIPPSSFYVDPDEGKNLVRFAFCKDDETLNTAVALMKARLKPNKVIQS